MKWIAVLVQNEVTHNDENAINSMEQLLADIVKTSNEATSMMAGLENELTLIEVCRSLLFLPMSK